LTPDHIKRNTTNMLVFMSSLHSEA
jgi:hypothetical protein